MSDVQRKIEDMLKEHGFWVLRFSKNLVWTDGTHRMVTPRSASDHRAYQNVKRDLGKVLALRAAKQGA